MRNKHDFVIFKGQNVGTGWAADEKTENEGGWGGGGVGGGAGGGGWPGSDNHKLRKTQNTCSAEI